MAMKYTALLTFGIGDETVTFTGREPFVVEDPVFKKELLKLGVFKEHEDGALSYCGKVSVPTKDGREICVDDKGYLPCKKEDLDAKVKDFR